MALLALELSPSRVLPSLEDRLRLELPVPLTFPIVGRGLFPARSLFCSLLTHGMILGMLLFTPILFSVTSQSQAVNLDAEVTDTTRVLYLPRLGGGSEGNGRAGGGSIVRRKGSSDTPARPSTGFSYPGPQPIISDPPRPTNHIQTILQPGIKNPPTLQPLIPLPNIVRTANAAPIPSLAPPTELVAPLPDDLKPRAPNAARAKPEMAAPVIAPPLTAQIDPARLALPTSAPARPMVPTALNAPKPRAMRPDDASDSAAQFAPVPTRGSDLQNLLVLSPSPAPVEPSSGLPAGESRGRFAISPEANPGNPQAGPGSKVGGGPGTTAGVGSQTEASAGNSAAQGEVGIANGADRLAIGGNGGTGLGTGKTSGSGNGGVGGTDAGRGSGSGAGIGTGSGTSSASGAGAGGGRGGGAFAGMTIQGGSLQNGTASLSPRVGFPKGPRPLYGMTVVSTASSGSGLGDYGIFSHEQVYTVYMDMRSTPEDGTPPWTLQCAVLPADGADPAKPQIQISGTEGFLPPFPKFKEQPAIPIEILRRYLARMVIVYAVIDAEGKLGQLSVRESPDPQLNKPVLEALAKWSFRPAEMNGNPVGVKILLGIPLALPE